MRSTLGGKKSNKDSNAILRQYSTFLCWSYVSTNENPPRMKSDVRQWMVDVIRPTMHWLLCFVNSIWRLPKEWLQQPFCIICLLYHTQANGSYHFADISMV
jgi:hypothetical protein